MGNSRMYVHETITISVEHRAEYLDHFTRVWAPLSRRFNDLHCFGVWATNGSTGRWPEAVVMWELDGPAAFSRMMSREYAHLDAQAVQELPTGSHHELYWASAPDGVRDRGGFDRLLAPTPATPTLDEAIAEERSGAIYYQEVVTVRPGLVDEYLERHEAQWRPLAERHGLVFVGAYRTMLRNDSEAVVLWALPHQSHWEVLDRELRTDPQARAFRKDTADLGADWAGTLLVGAPASPLDTGRRL